MMKYLIIALLATSITHADTRVIENSVGYSHDLFEDMHPIQGYTKHVTVTENSHLFISGHIDSQHRGLYGTADEAIMVAFKVKVNGRWLKGSTTGGNIVGTKQRYYSAQIHGYKYLETGDYVISVYGRSASTAAPGFGGLAEIKASMNHVIYKIVTD